MELPLEGVGREAENMLQLLENGVRSACLHGVDEDLVSMHPGHKQRSAMPRQ